MSQKKAIAKEESAEALNKAERTIWIWASILTVVFLFGWPLLALPAGVWSKVGTYRWHDLESCEARILTNNRLPSES